MTDPVLRQRSSRTSAPTEAKSSGRSVSARSNSEDSRLISILDIFRVISTLCIVSLALSYYITSGESLLWGCRPWITRPGLLKAYFKGPVQLTPVQLSLYNGTDPGLPIYIAINGTIFDVSVSGHTYGPGGSYHVFAGRDATRAFVTGCFLEDTTSDLRGAEEMYIPIDEEGEDISSREKKLRSERERREGRKRVQKEVEKWVKFYTNSKKYFEVGKVVGGRKHDGIAPQLCASAAKSRPKRRRVGDEAENYEEGKPV